jgi:hypothetical protein
VSRIARAGHVVRVNSDRTLKKIFNRKPEGVRSVGRPKLRWQDVVNQDIKTLGSRIGRLPPSRETNGHSFLGRPGLTKGCRSGGDGGDDDYDYDDDDDDDGSFSEN